MIGNYLLPNLHIDLEQFWFQQNATSPHIIIETIGLLKEQFDNIIIPTTESMN